MNLEIIISTINDSQRRNLGNLGQLRGDSLVALSHKLNDVQPKDVDVMGETTPSGNVIVKDEAGLVIFDLNEHKMLNQLASDQFELVIYPGEESIEDLEKLKFYVRNLLIVDMEMEARKTLVDIYETVISEIHERRTA